LLLDMQKRVHRLCQAALGPDSTSGLASAHSS
jgi:hypothetical protein